MKKEKIFEYVQKQYGTMPEYLWSKLPDSAVLRHKNGKWVFPKQKDIKKQPMFTCLQTKEYCY